MTDLAPRLIMAAAPRRPGGVVLVLHGGRERSTAAVRPWQLAVLRLIPVAREVVAQADGQAAVVRLLYRMRGWNGPQRPALDDARWAVAQCRDRFGADVPIALIGHSMGGRVALRVADEPGVVGVVGMAPWLPEHEPRRQVAGRRLLVMHGTSDHTTDPRASAAYVADVAPTVTSASYLRIRHEGHAMLRHRRTIDAVAAGFALGCLGLDGRRTADGPAANLVSKALAGQPQLEL